MNRRTSLSYSAFMCNSVISENLRFVVHKLLMSSLCSCFLPKVRPNIWTVVVVCPPDNDDDESLLLLELMHFCLLSEFVSDCCTNIVFLDEETEII